MTYPDIPTLHKERNFEMTWKEYADYLSETEESLSPQQTLIVASDGFRLHETDSELAEAIGTTVNNIQTQRTKIDLKTFTEPTVTEVWKTPWPATAFRKIGEAYIPKEDIVSKEIDLFVQVDGRGTLVAERVSTSRMEEKTSSGLVAEPHTECVTTRVWNSWEDYCEHSEYSPDNKDYSQDELGFRGEVSGVLAE